jgi:hypothetical protein
MYTAKYGASKEPPAKKIKATQRDVFGKLWMLIANIIMCLSAELLGTATLHKYVPEGEEGR